MKQLHNCSRLSHQPLLNSACRPERAVILRSPPTAAGRPAGIRQITAADARNLLRAYGQQVEAWAKEIVRRRVRGHLRERALAEIVPAVPGDVTVQFIRAVRLGLVLGNTRGLLFTFTKRVTMAAVRNRWRLDRIEDSSLSSVGLGEPSDEAPDPERALINSEEAEARAAEQERVKALVRRLPKRDRRLLKARFRDKPIPLKALSQQLGITEPAARVAVFRAVGKLRASMKHAA